MPIRPSRSSRRWPRSSGSSAPATYAELDTSRVIGRALQTTVSDVTILKFGGTSVADAAAFTRVVTIVRRRGGPRPVVVVSALAGMTDALFAGAAAAAEGDVARARGIVDEQLARHDGVGCALLQGDAALAFQDELENARHELTGLLDRLAGRAEQPAVLQDEIVSYGERLSASLLAAALAAAGVPARAVDARRCVITDETHGRATPLPAETERHTRAELVPLLEAALVPVVGGYIAATPGGRTTTLGRGGSDYRSEERRVGKEGRSRW